MLTVAQAVRSSRPSNVILPARHMAKAAAGKEKTYSFTLEVCPY